MDQVKLVINSVKYSEKYIWKEIDLTGGVLINGICNAMLNILRLLKDIPPATQMLHLF